MISCPGRHESSGLSRVQKLSFLINLSLDRIRQISKRLVAWATPSSLTGYRRTARVEIICAKYAIVASQEFLAVCPATESLKVPPVRDPSQQAWASLSNMADKQILVKARSVPSKATLDPSQLENKSRFLLSGASAISPSSGAPPQ